MTKLKEEDGGASVPVNNAGDGNIEGLDLGYPVKKSSKTKNLASLIKKKMVKRKPVV